MSEPDRSAWTTMPLLAGTVILLGIALTFALGPVAGFVVFGASIVMVPFLLRRRHGHAPAGPGASGPGEPGYRGRVHVGDDPGLVD